MSRLRTFAEALISRLPPRFQPMMRWRFIKFGLVGGSGTVINTVVLYLAQEHLLKGIADFHSRLNYSIALAITLATISNFYWNRRLTWRDRTRNTPQPALRLFVKYVMAAALSIIIQSMLTKWLALYLHYIVANLIAIVLASVVNFIANDKLTFRRHRAKIPAAGNANQSAPPPSNAHDKP
ncbi:MAG: GtrA family protein [Polaromonas sp.]